MYKPGGGISGRLSAVIPTTACTGASGVNERRFLANRFQIGIVITSHDPKRISFSENTSIHESLLVCRRSLNDDRPATKFVSLRELPTSADHAVKMADAIASHESGDFGNVTFWPSSRVEAGDWTPAQWYDGTLAKTVFEIESRNDLVPVGFSYGIDATGPTIMSAFEVVDEVDKSKAIPGFHSVSSRIRRTIAGQPDVMYQARKGKITVAERLLDKRGHLLLSMRHNTVSGRLTALWSATPSFGWWVPVAVHEVDRQKALAVWCNSTPARLMLLNRRGKTLTYPMWQVSHLREIRIPKHENSAWDVLRATYDEVCQTELLPMKQASECEARKKIDKAAALVLDIDPKEIADWRRRLAAEPTVTNRRAAS